MKKQTIIPTIEIKAFIVPNSSWCYDPKFGNAPVGNCNDFYTMKQFVDHCEAIKRVGLNPYSFKSEGENQPLNITTASHWVQLWLYNDEYDNMVDHGMPDELYKVIKDMPNGNRVSALLPECYPEEFLVGVHEGDTKDTYVKKWDNEKSAYVDVAHIHWTFIQGEMRYRHHGTFEEVLNKVLSHGRSFAKK